MKISKQRLIKIIKEEISNFNEVLQDAGGVWVIERTGVGSDERYLQRGNQWGPLWDPEVPDVVGALVFGDKAEAVAYLRQSDISTDNRPYPSFYSDDDLEKMELSVEDLASEEEEREAYPDARKAMAIQRTRQKRAWEDA
tara:strand:- start:321 stop:740 length:420 start_codon:yes stop_codon:yes gene_type:complete